MVYPKILNITIDKRTTRSRRANIIAGSVLGLAILGVFGSLIAFVGDENGRARAVAEAAPADGFEISEGQVRAYGLSSVRLDLGSCTMDDVSVEYKDGDNISYTFERVRSFSGQSSVNDSFTVANATELEELLGGDPCQVLARTGNNIPQPTTTTLG